MAVLRSFWAAFWVTALSVIGASAVAQPLISNLNDVVPNYNLDQIEGMLTELDVPYQRKISNNGQAYLLADIDGLNIILQPSACADGVCDGLKLICFFTNYTAASDVMNVFNGVSPAVRMYVDGNNRTYFSRYLIGDYGYTRGSFVVNLAVFAASPEAYITQFLPLFDQGTAETISLDATTAQTFYSPGEVSPTDVFAEDLNAQQINKLNNNPHGRMGDNETALLKVMTALGVDEAVSFDDVDLPETDGNQLGDIKVNP